YDCFDGYGGCVCECCGVGSESCTLSVAAPAEALGGIGVLAAKEGDGCDGFGCLILRDLRETFFFLRHLRDLRETCLFFAY
ncbi:MAG: hypothetical protein JW973_16735, partial [Bacteroidales bacterium]|nr:hypothetical protein [Bacteroidales bacterium]